MKTRSFTLIELLIVLVIIGIVVTLAVPQYKVMIIRMRGVEAMKNLRVLSDSLWRYNIETGTFPGFVTLPIGRMAPSPALDTTLPSQSTKYFNYDYIGATQLNAGWEAYDVDADMNAPIGSIVKYAELYLYTPVWEGINGKRMGNTNYYVYRYHLVKQTMGGGTPLPLFVPGWPGEKW